MTTRARADEYSSHLSAVAGMASAELRDGAARLIAGAGSVAEARDAVIALMASLNGAYGDVAAALACELYEDAALEEAGLYLVADAAEPWGAERFDEAVRYSARRFGAADQDASISYLADKLARGVKQAAHDTTAANAVRDAGTGVRFARVPQGAETCDYCLLVASYGYVFPTRERAGELTRFHDNCDCTVEASWEGGASGLDPAHPGRYTPA